MDANRRRFPTHELDELARRYGRPLEETVRLGPSGRGSGTGGFFLHGKKRQAEVVLVIPRPGRRVALHTKSFYPRGVWRLPTGGVRRNEAIIDAVRREAHEETGLDLSPARFLFHIRYQWGEPVREFHSYGFLTTEAAGRLKSLDPRERITAFVDFDRGQIEENVRLLESLSDGWESWGRFRAAPHRALLRIWPLDEPPATRSA